jgi:hypothetical protein
LNHGTELFVEVRSNVVAGTAQERLLTTCGQMLFI